MLESVLNQMYNFENGNRIFDCRLVATSTLWEERWLRWSLDETKASLAAVLIVVHPPTELLFVVHPPAG